MNIICCYVKGSFYLLMTVDEELQVHTYSHESASFVFLKSLIAEYVISSLSVCPYNDSATLVVLGTDKGISFVWAPLFSCLHVLSPVIRSASDVLLGMVKSNLLVSSSSKFYVSNSLSPNGDDIDIRSEAVKVSVELGSINQLLPSEDDTIVDLITLATASSSVVMILKNTKTGFYSVRWAEVEKTIKVKWSMAISSEILSVISLTDRQEVKSSAIALIASAQTLYFVNATGVLNQIKLSVEGFMVSLVCLDSGSERDCYQLLISCSESQYYCVVIAKSSRQLVSCVEYTPSASPLLPCCETMTLLSSAQDDNSNNSNSPLYLNVFGYHSLFGYQVLRLTCEIQQKEKSQDVVWQDGNCRLSGITKLIALPESLSSVHLAVCQSSALDQSMLYKCHQGLAFQTLASTEIEGTPALSLCALSLSSADETKDTLVIFSNPLTHQSALYAVKRSTFELLPGSGSYVMDECTQGLLEISGRLLQITSSGVTPLKRHTDNRVTLDGPKCIFGDIVQAAMRRDVPNYQYFMDSEIDCITRPSTRQEVSAAIKLSASPVIDHFSSTLNAIVLSIKNLIVLVSVGELNSVSEVHLTAGEVSCLTSSDDDDAPVQLLCIALWNKNEVWIKSSASSHKKSHLSTLCVVKLSDDAGSIAVGTVRHMALLGTDLRPTLVCGFSNGLVYVVQLTLNNIKPSDCSYNVMQKFHFIDGMNSLLKLSSNVAIVYSDARMRTLTRSAEGEWVISDIACGANNSTHHSLVRIDSDKIARMQQSSDNSLSFEIGLLVGNPSLSRVSSRLQLEGLVLDVVIVENKILVLHKTSSNVYRVSALESNSLGCFWSHCIGPDNSVGLVKQYRLVAGPEPPTASKAALRDVLVFSLIVSDGVTPLGDITPGTGNVSVPAGAVKCTTFMLRQSEKGVWSHLTIGGVSLPYKRITEWKEDQVRTLSAHNTLHCASVGATALALVVPFNRVAVLSWTDNRRERTALLDKAMRSGKQNVVVPQLTVKLETIAEYIDIDAQTDVISLCSSNGKFIYLGLASMGVDILMLSKSESFSFEGNGFILQTVFKLRDVSISPRTSISASCVEPSMFLSTASVTQPVNKFKITCFGDTDPFLVSVDINGILRTTNEPFDQNNEILQVKPVISKLVVVGKGQIKFVGATSSESDSGSVTFRFRDESGNRLQVEETSQSI